MYDTIRGTIMYLGVLLDGAQNVFVARCLEVKEGRLKSLVLGRYATDVAKGATVYVVHGDDMRCGPKALEHRGCRRRARCKCESLCAPRFNRGESSLEGITVWIARARVFEALSEGQCARGWVIFLGRTLCTPMASCL